MLALPKTGTPSEIAQRISLCHTEGSPGEIAVDDADGTRGGFSGAIDIALGNRGQADELPGGQPPPRGRERRADEDDGRS